MCPCGFTINAIVSPWQQIAKIQDANGQLRALKTIATKVERLVHPTSCGAEAAVLQDIKSKKLEHLTYPAVYEVLETDRFTQVVTDFYPCDTVELVVAHKEAHGTTLPADTVMYVAVTDRQAAAGGPCLLHANDAADALPPAETWRRSCFTAWPTTTRTALFIGVWEADWVIFRAGGRGTGAPRVPSAW
jgi:hypothetical protein